MSKKRVVILARVSTSKQETSRQVAQLQEVCEQKGWKVSHVINETVSGASTKRPDLDKILELARAGEIEKVAVHEVSRIARTNSVSHSFLEELDEHGVSLYWHSQGVETRLENGRRNPAASIMFALLAEMARSEREQLRERIRSGLKQAAKNGRYPGRRKGSGMTKEQFLDKHKDVVRKLRAGRSVREVVAITGKSQSLVAKASKLLKG